MKLKYTSSLLLSPVLVSGIAALNAPETFSSKLSDVHPRALNISKPPGPDSNPKNATRIEKSWNGATLWQFDRDADLGGNVSASAGVEVTCTTCYVKGLVTAELNPSHDFNIIQAITNFTDDVGEEIQNITRAAFTYLADNVPELAKNLTDDFDFDDISFPPLNTSLSLHLPDIPECDLHFQFDELELYASMDTVLSAGTVYTLNLYSSNTPIGLSIDSDTLVGVVVSIDLILSADADIDIGSGLHVKFDDGMTLDLPLFSQNVSSVTFTGGSFEFLPVAVRSAEGILTAKIRAGVHAGVSLDADSLTEIVPVSTGAEVLVYADLAEFTTNVTAVPGGDDDNCELRIQQIYQLALGAGAGASLAIGSETWGPDLATNIPIFYTTLADECAESVTKTSSATVSTATPTIAARADKDMTTTTLSDEVTYTGLVCLSTGLVECPASLQSVTKVVSTTTLIVTVPSGSEATFPATTQNTIPETFPFAKNVKSITATTGSPVSYVPPPPPTSSSQSDDSNSKPDNKPDNNNPGETSSAGPNKPLIIGLSVGLGVPFLAAVAAALYFFSKRRRYSAVAKAEFPPTITPQQIPDDGTQQKTKPVPTVTATEYHAVST
ncbi:hypothetical protein F4861DRAFT_514003 [Xylaria intraflava]|nr:hypothetical protein F4861DRAFT_514003 [Xylaria intraflava]